MKNRLTYSERAPHCQAALARNLFELLARKETNLALSADVTSAATLLQLADELGPEICVLKTHIDIISDYSPDLPQKLHALARKHDFLLFEDRKFADIGNTVQHQYAGGVYRIADWSDMINAHILPGPGIIQALAHVGAEKQRGLILIAEMSSKGHLLNKAYQEQALQMAQSYPEFVIGFITQHALSDQPQWLNMTPGIQFQESQDALGQQYVTPEIAIRENGSDILIVGRGILKADNPKMTAQRYRQRAWQAYLDTTK